MTQKTKIIDRTIIAKRMGIDVNDCEEMSNILLEDVKESVEKGIKIMANQGAQNIKVSYDELNCVATITYSI